MRTKSKTKIHTQFIEELNTINNNIEIVSEYTKARKNVDCVCKVCGHEFSTTPNDLLRGSDCKKCYHVRSSEHQRMTHDEFIDKLKQVNEDVICLGIYDGTKNKMKFKCQKCGKVFDMVVANLLYNNRGCTKCSPPSNGEKIIDDFLSLYDMEYTKQKTYDGLIGLNRGKLSYDFYLPVYNILIEFHGIQHEKSIEYFGGKEQLKVQQEHDRRKMQYCVDNNIELLEIWYWEMDFIEAILIKELKLKPIKESE